MPNITYFKLVAEYLDNSGNVLDSEYTNSINTILPGNMEEFEIMKKHNDQYKQVRIFIEEIKTLKTNGEIVSPKRCFYSVEK